MTGTHTDSQITVYQQNIFKMIKCTEQIGIQYFYRIEFSCISEPIDVS